jgi:hypothetical protein
MPASSSTKIDRRRAIVAVATLVGMTRGEMVMRGSQRAMTISVDGISGIELTRGGRTVAHVSMDEILAALSGKES